MDNDDWTDEQHSAEERMRDAASGLEGKRAELQEKRAELKALEARLKETTELAECGRQARRMMLLECSSAFIARHPATTADARIQYEKRLATFSYKELVTERDYLISQTEQNQREQRPQARYYRGEEIAEPTR